MKKLAALALPLRGPRLPAGQRLISLAAFVYFLLFSISLSAQTKTVTGTIRDEKGQPLAGASVLIKGSSEGTNTDAAGKFTIALPANGTLVVSSVGYSAQEIPVRGRTSLDVQIGTAAQAMDEVVVVGYGTQRRANLTGSVSSVSGATLTNRPVPNASNLLQGRVPGLQVTQPSAEPGRDYASFLIRGRGSFSGGTTNSPLVLIDGVTGSINNLAPDDIDNITVLKDAASASIYGARAANGVILVTTKKGRRGQSLISYRLNVGRYAPIGLPKLVTNSAEYMDMFNTAAVRSGVTFRYPQADIDKYRSGTDPLNYPNFNAIDYYFNPAVVSNHNLSMSGGNEKSTYNLSLGYLDQPAVLPWYKYKKYNVLLNYTSQVSKAITVGTSMNLTYRDQREPPVVSQYMALTVYATGPLYGPYLPDGSGRVVSRAYQNEGRNRNVSEYQVMGEQSTKEYNLNAQAYMDVKLLQGLTWSSKVAVNYTDVYFKMHQVPYLAYLSQEKDPATGDYRASSFGPDLLGVIDQYQKTINPTIYSTLTYDGKIGDHSFRVLAGYEQLYNRYQALRARRTSSVTPALDELTGYSATGESLYYFAFPTNHPRLPSIGRPYEWAMQSVFGRINYNYKGKYLVEGNLRYDGTSKVSPDYRWGVFPSVSAGWLVSEENFMKDKDWLSNLKLRASYGTLGNQDISTYAYQNVFETSVQYPFGNTGPLQGAVVNDFRDQSLRWESTRIVDVGFDLNIRKGLLGLSVDWFRKTTFNILASQPVPYSLGLNAPTFNNGKMENRGVEIELTHQHHIGKVTYGFNALFATAHNKVLAIRVPSKGTTIRDVGFPYDQHFLYVWDGIFQAQDTVAGAKVPRHALNPNPRPGDLKMKDVNGDGVVDANDRVAVKGVYPDFTYSFGVNAGYKNFALSAFFQGVQGVQNRITGWGVDPFTQGTAPTLDWRNAWTPQNPSTTMPAIYAGTYPGVTNYQGSTFYLRNASYMRLKNVVLSYAFAKSVYTRFRAQDLSVYVSADNLFTITQYKVGDPERSDVSSNFPTYPQVRILNAGINVKF